MNKKIIRSLSLGIITASLPVALVSCSSSWTKWDKKNAAKVSINYQNKTAKYNQQFEVRTNLKPTYTIGSLNSTISIDLNKINNQYELLQVIKEVLKFNISSPLDLFWNDLTDDDQSNDNRMIDFMQSLEQNITLKFIAGKGVKQESYDVKWDISKIVNKIKDIYDNYDLKKYPIDHKPLFPLKPEDINDKGLPINVTGVAIAGKDFINFKSIQGLLNLDSEFAMQLSKLVNLPKLAFDEFAKFIGSIDKLWGDIYQNKIFQYKWLNGFELLDKNNKVIFQGIDFRVQANGTINKEHESKNNLQILRGTFIIKGLKS